MSVGFSLHVHSLIANKQDAINVVENPHSTGSHESESLIKVKNINGSILLAAVNILLNFLWNYLQKLE
jgi:hypothetical protein